MASAQKLFKVKDSIDSSIANIQIKQSDTKSIRSKNSSASKSSILSGLRAKNISPGGVADLTHRFRVFNTEFSKAVKHSNFTETVTKE